MRVGVEAEHGKASVVERLREIVLQALGAGAVAGEGARAAGTALGDLLAVTAVVAGELPLAAVQDERDVALRDSSRRPRTSGRRGSWTSPGG